MNPHNVINDIRKPIIWGYIAAELIEFQEQRLTWNTLQEFVKDRHGLRPTVRELKELVYGKKIGSGHLIIDSFGVKFTTNLDDVEKYYLKHRYEIDLIKKKIESLNYYKIFPSKINDLKETA